VAQFPDIFQRYAYWGTGGAMIDDKLVLLVDDEQSLLKATSIGLKDRGFKVYTAESGELAIKAIRTLKPSIVVSDLAMPGMNGFELYQEVKKSAEYKTLPFIFLTAVDDFYAKKFGKELGGAAYMTKPVDLDELEQTLKEKMGE
jgi:two-component system alkaline phosphatase synthesis response regulator PhoP